MRSMIERRTESNLFLTNVLPYCKYLLILRMISTSDG